METFPAILLCSHSVRSAPSVPPQSPKPFTVWYPNFTWPRKMELLRHGCIAFVIRLLLAHYYGGIAPELIPKLASYSYQPTFLGHVDPTTAAVYLRATDALL